MTKEDYFESENFFKEHITKEVSDCKNNLIVSPVIEQMNLMCDVFGVCPKMSFKTDWNLMEKGNNTYDIIFASNVFMYIKEPKIAIENVLDCCKWFVLQDLITYYRGDINGFARDGDCMRYSYGELKSNYDLAYDLSCMGGKIFFFKHYFIPTNNINFITLIKGNL